MFLLPACSGMGFSLSFDKIFGGPSMENGVDSDRDDNDEEELTVGEADAGVRNPWDIPDGVGTGTDKIWDMSSWNVAGAIPEDFGAGDSFSEQEDFNTGGNEIAVDSQEIPIAPPAGGEFDGDDFADVNDVIPTDDTNKETVDDVLANTSIGNAGGTGSAASAENDPARPDGADWNLGRDGDLLGIPVTIAKLDSEKGEKILSWSNDGKKAFVLINRRRDEQSLNSLTGVRSYLYSIFKIIKDAHAESQDEQITNDPEDLITMLWDTTKVTENVVPVDIYSGSLQTPAEVADLEPSACNPENGTISVWEQLVDMEREVILKLCFNNNGPVRTSAAITYNYSDARILILFSSDAGDNFSYATYMSGSDQLLALKGASSAEQANSLYVFDVLTGANHIVLDGQYVGQQEPRVSDDGRYLMLHAPGTSMDYKCYHWQEDAMAYVSQPYQRLINLPAEVPVASLMMAWPQPSALGGSFSGDGLKYLFRGGNNFYTIDCKSLEVRYLFNDTNTLNVRYFVSGVDGKFLWATLLTLNWNMSHVTMTDMTTLIKRDFDWSASDYYVFISSHDLLIADKKRFKLYYLDLANLDLLVVNNFEKLLVASKQVDDSASPIKISTALQNTTFNFAGAKPSATIGPISYAASNKGRYFFVNQNGTDYLAQITTVGGTPLIFIQEFGSEEDGKIVNGKPVSCFFQALENSSQFPSIKNGRFAFYNCPLNRDGVGNFNKYLYDTEKNALYNMSDMIKECGFQDYLNFFNDIRVLDPSLDNTSLSMAIYFLYDNYTKRYLNIIKTNLVTGVCDEGMLE
ncbi:MAG: hypothetical protein HQM16_14245 [Deltaproteobacteria bacterium]|nr:hypothetical protein [Deltaproteobacteria bacterium]